MYLDTSVLISALTKETGSARAREALTSPPPDGWVISDWVVAEFASALSAKRRSGLLSAEERVEAFTRFRRMISESFAVLAISRTHFQVATEMSDQSDLGVRAGDALHLALGRSEGLTVCTMDHGMAKAGPALGARVRLI